MPHNPVLVVIGPIPMHQLPQNVTGLQPHSPEAEMEEEGNEKDTRQQEQDGNRLGAPSGFGHGRKYTGKA
jgi:hypothetical protein